VVRAKLNAVATICIALALAACRAPLVLPPSIPPPDSPGLHVLLTWDAPVDLDVYVTDPSWETVYFANTPSRAGGRLEADVRCDTLKRVGQQAEWVRYPEPHAGAYRIGVDFIDDCDSGHENVPFRVVVDLDGQRLERTGAVQLERFQPISSEFEVDASRKKLVDRTPHDGGTDDAAP
jgi:hypothetical protein